MKPNYQRTRIVKWFLYLYGISTVLLIIAELQQYSLLRSIIKGEISIYASGVASAGLFYLILYPLRLLIYFGLVVTFILWNYRAYKNLRFVTNAPQRFSAGWAIGAWFLPFINLWMPYAIMREIMSGSEIALERNQLIKKKKGRKFIVVCWWITYLLCYFLGTIFSYTIFFSTQSRLQKLFVIICVDIIILIPLILAIRMVNTYVKLEKLLPTLSTSELSESDLLDS